MQGTPKAIQIQGIVRNATVIGAQDGQAEDLINLRFMDGSWRASGDGRMINFTMGSEYTQLYVHTNVYHHLLGVNNGTLYWFAEIGTDGVTFYPLDSTADRTGWATDMQDLPTAPVALTTVVGDIWITQTGHLLTIIDEDDDFEYLVYKTGDNKYSMVDVDVNGKSSDRTLYPFGYVHFNLYSDVADSTLVHQKQIDAIDLSAGTTSPRYFSDIHEANESNLKTDKIIDDGTEKEASKLYHNTMVELFGEATKKNQFTRPFIAVLACKLYDGSYVYASNPVILYPRQVPTSQKHYVKTTLITASEEPIPPEIVDVPQNTQYKNVCTLCDNAMVFYNDSEHTPLNYIDMNTHGLIGSICGCILESERGNSSSRPTEQSFINQRGYAIHYVDKEHIPVYSNGVSGYYSKRKTSAIDSPEKSWSGMKYKATVVGSQLCLSTNIAAFLERNSDIFQSVCVFITPQADLWSLEADNKDGSVLVHLRTLEENDSASYPKIQTTAMTISYAPKMYDMEKVKGELLNSPMFLLREYNNNSLQELSTNPVIDLTNYIYDNILENITQQDRLDIESTSRAVYLPKVSYMYNGRLHIANYKSYPFFGYPIDLFHLHNHSVKVESNSWFKGVLPNLADNNDEYLQYEKAQKAITNYADLVTAEAPYFLVKVYIDSSQGEQVVCRYIPAYDPNNSPYPEHTADFIEDLNPLLTYPDARAKKMEIYYVNNYISNSSPAINGVYVKWQDFGLKPHPYLNLAYYIAPDLKPIKLADFKNLRESQPVEIE